jgi:sulfur relay (sulfurtransferase) DsrF/TusC family protein
MNYEIKILFKGRISKEELYPEAIEDYFAISDDARRIVLCDGASESYDSKNWAELLSNKYIQDPNLSERWIMDAIKEYSNKCNFDSLSWSKQLAFNRGSFSTLLGLQFLDDAMLEIVAVGDSIAVLLDDLEYITSFPYDISNKFQERPSLISTNVHNNYFIAESEFPNHTTWNLRDKKSCKILCMTDALAEWALKNNEICLPVWNKLLDIRDISTLHEYILDSRAKKEMKVDDSTLIVIELIQK